MFLDPSRRGVPERISRSIDLSAPPEKEIRVSHHCEYNETIAGKFSTDGGIHCSRSAQAMREEDDRKHGLIRERVIRFTAGFVFRSQPFLAFCVHVWRPIISQRCISERWELAEH